MIPAILGLTTASILAVSACFCARRYRLKNKKLNHDAIQFQPPKKTRAVRSPSGAPCHYLKKSPSPTSVKPLPGTLQASSPPDLQTSLKFVEEDERAISKKIQNDFRAPELNGMDDKDDNEFGKLGTLVFKLKYINEKCALVVSVVRCNGLPKRSLSTTNAPDIPANANGKTQNVTDPYVKLQLLPDKQHKVKTR